MAEQDEWDAKAAELVPCQWITRLCDPRFEEVCGGCRCRPAVAAELRAQGQKIERLQIEIASLKSPQPGPEQNYYFMLQGAKQEIAQLKDQLDEAEKRGMERAIDILMQQNLRSSDGMFYRPDTVVTEAIRAIRAAMQPEPKEGP